MSDAKRAPGLSRPGMWLAHVTMPPPVLTRWGWTWRLTVRCFATLSMTALGALGIASGIASGSLDWFDLLVWAVGWSCSVLFTVGAVVAFVRRPRAAGGERG